MAADMAQVVEPGNEEKEATPISPTELLFRQVHPDFFRDGRMTSQAFRPTKKDAGKLSVSRSSLTTARDAFRLFVKGVPGGSAGTWAVSASECSACGVPAAGEPLPDDPAHAAVRFDGLSGKQVEKVGGTLRDAALKRGAVFEPSSEGVVESDPPLRVQNHESEEVLEGGAEGEG